MENAAQIAEKLETLTAKAVALGSSDPDDFLSQFLEPSAEEDAAWAEVEALKAELKIARAAEAADKRYTPKHKPCPRCGGNGLIASYMHIANGKCFKCDGVGHVFC